MEEILYFVFLFFFMERDSLCVFVCEVGSVMHENKNETINLYLQIFFNYILSR